VRKSDEGTQNRIVLVVLKPQKVSSQNQQISDLEIFLKTRLAVL
jgi:hypothetical protein